VLVRPVTPDDAGAIARLSEQLGYPAEPAEVAALLAPIIADPYHAVFVGVGEDGAVAAWAHVFLSHRVFTPVFAELGGLVVERSLRRSGLASALLKRRRTIRAEDLLADDFYLKEKEHITVER
jgi:GNAT superfamily N-acetyltransferase